MTNYHNRRGFALLTVLIVSAIGLLFGAGALLLYRNQCRLRIDRQHELEKIYAVRSALNYVRPSNMKIPLLGQSFGYEAGSGRHLTVFVKPVDNIFPNSKKIFADDPRCHFATDEENMASFTCFPTATIQHSQYNGYYDYEFGGEGNGVSAGECITNRLVEIGKNDKKTTWRGLVFTNNTDSAAKLWLNIGMRDTGGWLQEDYGRRYFFRLKDYAPGDIIRLCLVRNVTNESNSAGCRHGWPLSKPKESALGTKEMALIFQITLAVEAGEAPELKCFAQRYLEETPICLLTNNDFPGDHKDQIQNLRYMGIQLAKDKISLFQIDTLNFEGASYDMSSSGYVFSSIATIPEDVYTYFAKYYSEKEHCWKIYDGSEKDESGKRIAAPELRAILEVESATKAAITVLSDFRVTPAYQYDVYTVRPELAYKDSRTGRYCYDLVTNRATVAQRLLPHVNQTAPQTVLTYDTHGTENKGFRKDEREAERRRNGQ